MNRKAVLDILPDHVDGVRDFKIFGHFLEHFHRQIYGGVYDPGSHLSDANGFRRDVIEALRRIKAPVIRWPGGCFVSAYPWKKGRRAARSLLRQSLARRGAHQLRHR